jgi:hypothetical protein
MSEGPQISNPFSTGGGGVDFENQVQSVFAVLMLSGGVAPCLPPWRIVKVKLQGRYSGFRTDDCIVFVKDHSQSKSAKLLAQIKHSVSITQNDLVFGEVINAAWSDFQDRELFDPAIDVLALITGPLSANDVENARSLPEWARHSESAQDFLEKVNLAKFSSAAKQEKLQAFRSQLQKANGGVDIGDDRLWRFLKCYHLLGYDLDVRSGVTLSLLRSHIGQFSIDNLDGLWSQAAKEVASFNRTAGTLTIDTLSTELKAAFAERRVETIPSHLLRRDEARDTTTTANYFVSPEYVDCLRVASLLGEWNEKVPADMAVAKKMVGGGEEDFTVWVAFTRKISLLADSPLKQVDGRWKVANRKEAWLSTAPQVFDAHLNQLRDISREVLGEHDPQFDLAPQDRFYATIRKKVFQFSSALREGLSTTLALLGTFPTALTSASHGKAEATALLSVRDILENADWLTWASLNDQLPLLAEASPSEFLSHVEHSLNQNPSPFVQVYAQEGGMPIGQNFMTGLLWALEALAWDADHLVRVIAILGDLAAMDPGGRWANRPANSLREILLPWHAQTSASIAKRKVAVATLLREQPSTGLKLLLSLLPDTHSGATGTNKPAIREFVPKDWNETTVVADQDYWDQVTGYAEMARQAAEADMSKLDEVVQCIANLPETTVTKLLDFLRSDRVKELAEKDRWPIWKSLVSLATQHKKFPDADWAMSDETIAKLDETASLLAPKSLSLIHRRLFTDHDFQLYEQTSDFEAEQKKLAEHRQSAVQEILHALGLPEILDFVRHVDTPLKVGIALGQIDLDTLDKELLSAHLLTEERPIAAMIEGFVRAKLWKHGWPWVDQQITPAWSQEQMLALLTLLPVTPETWNRATRLLGDEGKAYWEKAGINGWGSEESVSEAITNLVRFGRPRTALAYLRNFGMEFESLTRPVAIKLLFALAQVDEPGVALDGDTALRLISWLQNNPVSDSEELAKIEWAYLPLFTRAGCGTPKTLGQRMANDPSFFCEVIATVFRSKQEEQAKTEPTEDEKRMAQAAFTLLRRWNIVPGTSPQGTFDPAAFEKWLAEVRQKTTDSGHFDAAMGQFGEVLHNAPPDPADLWIHRTVAEALNARDADPMRAGFERGLMNRRGAYWGTGGKAELEIAAGYHKQAEALELNGFHRFATTVRELAKRYERDSQRDAAIGADDH